PDDVPADLPLRDLGFDSLGLMDLAKRIEDRTGARVRPANVDDGSTLRSMAASIVRQFAAATALDDPSAVTASDTGDVPFSAAQIAALQRGQWSWWNRAVMLDVHGRLEPEQLRR